MRPQTWLYMTSYWCLWTFEATGVRRLSIDKQLPTFPKNLLSSSWSKKHLSWGSWTQQMKRARSSEILFTSTYRSIRCQITEYLNFRQQSSANLESVSHVCMQLIPPYLNAYRIFFLQNTVIWPSLSTYKIKPFHFLPYGLESTTNVQDILSDNY